MLDVALNQTETEEEDINTDRQGQWLRRRRLNVLYQISCEHTLLTIEFFLDTKIIRIYMY
jgi:hypothetical protein